MTKQWIAIVFLLTNLICVVSMYHLRRSEHYMKKSVQYIMRICCLITVSYLITLFSNHYIIDKVAYCVYMASVVWGCAAVLYFSYCFLENKKVPIKYIIFVLFVLVTDTIFLSFSILEKIPINYQAIHSYICYLIIGISVLLLFYRVILSAKVFRIQYLTLLVGFSVLTLVKQLLDHSHFTYDYAILEYNFAAIFLCHYVLYYASRQRINRMSRMVLKSIPSMLLMFDCQGMLIYKNYSIVSTVIHGRNQKDILRELAIDETKKYVPVVKEFINTVSKEKRVYQVSYKQLFDENMLHQRKEVGSCLIINDITEDRERLNCSTYLANHDSLTGLYSKIYFCECSQQLIMENPTVEFAILMVDIYQFTQYNVCFGTKTGDLVIQRIAYELITKTHDPLIRYGRYEAGRFVVCLPLSYCNESFFKEHGFYDAIHTNRYQLTLYYGICPISAEDESLQIVCEHALAALDTIKGSNTKKIAVYNAEMRKQFLMKNRLISDFPKAIKSGAIVGYIQPQINQLTKQIIGGEVLARWIDVDGRVISPGVFIPILENSNLISKLDYYIWEETCRLIKQSELDGTPVALSVNLSAQDFYHFDIYDVFVKLIEQYQINPKYLRLEITESDVICNIAKQLPLIKMLQSKGFLVEMDDFGSGYSSLNTLKDIPVDVLKMDMKFLDDAKRQERSQTIIRNIIRMSKELELAVIAEGVETVEQAEFLKDAGCHLIQGYLYGKPMKACEFLELYKQNVNDEKTIG